uniref:plasmid fertility inhibition factor family protein n=1 Tax=Pasteurella multocida TaxID=747 RepID=UPI00403D6BB7
MAKLDKEQVIDNALILPVTTEGAPDSNFVVYVNGLAFYRAWLCLKVDDYQACPLKQDMPNDRKFHWSEAHFAIGIENPVPLADVVPTEVSGRFAVAFYEYFFLFLPLDIEED